MFSVAGSLRDGPYTRALLRTAREESPDGIPIDIFDHDNLPPFNADLEGERNPERVTARTKRMRSSAAVLIAIPEYNHGVPAVINNAADRASRLSRNAPLDETPVGLVDACPRMTGSARRQPQLRQAFEFSTAYCMPQPEILVSRAHENFDETGRLTDEKTRTYLGKYLTALGQWTGQCTTSADDPHRI